MQHQFELPKSYEEEQVKSEVIVLADKGLGFGDGPISTERQLTTGELTEPALAVAREVVLHDPRSFVAIDADITDDGCGDGRPAVDTWMVDEEGGEIHYNKSYPRAKLFGGGLVVASSMWRTLAGRPAADDSVLADREFVSAALHARDIQYGGHSDDHADGDACGCGAIDKYPDVSQNIIVHRDAITTTLKALYGDGFDANAAAVERVFSSYDVLVGQEEFFRDAAGVKTMKLMNNEGAVIKKLAGGHQEDVIVLNDIEGTTFNQPAFDEMLKSRGIDKVVQAFVVDVWRGRMYADAMAEIAMERQIPGTKDELARVAYADFLIRTLAVAATLTGGDLPVYARRHEAQADFAFGH